MVISGFRGGGVCKAKVESVEPSDSGYEVKGTYVLTEYILFSGERVLEEGEFVATLDEEYRVVSIKIVPSKPAHRRGSRA